MILSRDDILKADDISTEEVEVPEWKGTVLVRGMTGEERDVWEALTTVKRGNQFVPDTANATAKLVAMCVVNEDGSRMFTDADAAELGKKSAAAVGRIFRAAARLSGIMPEDIEEMVADFSRTPGSSSSSGSPKNSGKPSRSS